MNHVTHRLDAWLGGELDAAEAAALAAHLDACPACRREADARRAVWDLLEAAAPEPSPVRAWPGVRARTLGTGRPGWFFGGSPALRAGLATAAVALGLVAGLALPGGRAAADGAPEAGLWLGGASWSADDGAALEDLWLGEVPVPEASS